MSGARHWIAGSVVTLGVVAATAVLSAWPAWQVLPSDTGVLSVTFSQGGARDCRPLTEDELKRLPANMRRKEVCDRERAALRFEIDIDGEPVLRQVLTPGGLAGDAAAHVYERFRLPAGEHEVAVRLADSGREDGFDYTAAQTIHLAPAQNRVIDFNAQEGGFIFR